MRVKRFAAVALAGVMGMSMLAGCGDSGKDESTTAAAKSDASEATDATEAASEEEAIKTTLTVWGPAEDQSPDYGEWLQTTCEAFKKEHPNWDITFEYGTCSEGDAGKTVTQDVSASADIYMFANDQLQTLIDAGAISELGGSTADYVKSTNSQAIVDSITVDGGIYGVPFTTNTWFMYYNKKTFTEDDVKSLDTMLTKGKVSFPFDNGWYLNAFYAANGCTIFGDGTDKAAGYDFSGDKGTAVTNYIVDLFANPNFVMDNNEGSLGLAGLKDGSINAYFNGNWNYDKVKEALGEENVGVAALPTINIGGKDCQLKAFLGSKAIGVNPNCKNQEVAVKLAAFLGSEDAQLAHFKLRGQAPVNKDLATNEEVAADPVAAAMAKVSSDCSVAQPIIDMSGYWDAATPFGDAFQNGAEGQITKDNAAQKTEDFNTQLNDSLK